MPRVQPFTVISDLPERLAPLRGLASNMWWSWNHQAKGVFIRVFKDRYVKARKNAVELVNSLSRAEIDALEKDKGFLTLLREVDSDFKSYLESPSWWQGRSEYDDLSVAYFSAEFGLHESVPIYSGGLGVLAGDYLKAASDLGLPVSAVGLLYYEGYFSQYLSADGWQKETYPQIEMIHLPIKPVLGADGRPVTVPVEVGHETVKVRAWRIEVGRVKLYLLDTNFDENPPSLRGITARLYGGDIHQRIKQEIVLGIGGLRLLRAIGANPSICHMNEGHSAFLALEKIRLLMAEHKLDFESALNGVRATHLFTTHTPVPAGNDVFSRELITEYFNRYAVEAAIDIETILQLGRVHQDNPQEPFSVTVLALRTAAAANGVSRLHGQVSRKLWSGIWPEVPMDEVPIDHVTNGVHNPTWTSRDIADLYDRHLGPAWRERTAAPEVWSAVEDIPDEEIWRIIGHRRTSLVAYVRERLKAQLMRRGAGRVEIEHVAHVLDPDALTIGFARRFASYKRATLIFHDVERLVRLVNNIETPVQFIFSGKAHPADQPGKELIERIIRVSRRPDLRARVVFLEDYDMGVARTLVQAVDIWMNNPRRPLEASATSGMKAAVNGVLNLSVLDGWWCEAFDGENGWAIGQGEEYDDHHYQDDLESRSIYDLLEREVIPTFYQRGSDGVPRDWIQMIKHSIRTIAPQFSAHRMAMDYANMYYLPLGRELRQMQQDNYSRVRTVTEQMGRFRDGWPKVRIHDVKTNGVDHLALGRSLPIKVTAELGPFSPEEVACEVYFGALDATQHIHGSDVVRLDKVQPSGENGFVDFCGDIETERAGSYGFSVRIVPVIDGKTVSTVPRLIAWWQ